MCDLFRRSLPSVSTGEKAPGPKLRRRRQGKLFLPPLHSTRGGTVGQPAPSVHTHECACMQGRCNFV